MNVSFISQTPDRCSLVEFLEDFTQCYSSAHLELPCPGATTLQSQETNE